MNSYLAAHAGRWLGVVLAVSLMYLPGVAAADLPADPPAEPTFTLAGGGYGHGTGMSQYGAQGQALAGRTWQQILGTYFTGIRFAYLRAEPTPGQIGDEGPLWVGLDQNLTHQDIRLVPLTADPHYVRVTRGADQVDVFAGANVTMSFDFTPAGCTFSVTGLQWPAGPCDFELEWDGWEETPTVALDTTLADDDPSCDQPGERCYSRGTLLIRPNAAAGDTVTGFHLVVLIDMEDYLYGLLEVPYSWHPQALAAQAVAGRSYAANKQALRGSPEESTLRQELCWCELYDSTVDQYYAGWGREADAWTKGAVDATAGLVIYHPDVVAPSFHPRAGEPIAVPTFYSSSSFGHTEDSGVAFGSGFTPSYLVGVPDPWSVAPEAGNPLATWEKVITRRDLAGMVGLDTVDDVAIISWLRPGTEHQSAYQVSFTGTINGEPATRTRFARQLRTQLGLRSMQITSVEKIVPDGWIDTGGGGSEPDQVGMHDPTAGLWYLRDADGTVRDGFYYGIPGDSPITCDWDGLDGVSTVGLYRSASGFMYLRDSNEFGIAENDFWFGIPEDLPICGDWDGNGTETIGIFRPSNRTFYVTNTNQTQFADQEAILEAPGTVPLAGDWNGDGFDTVGLYDPVSRTVSLTNSLTNPTVAISYAYNTIPEDKIITGDWDGDGVDTVGVFRPPDVAFYLRDDFVMPASNHTIEFFGEPHWTPVAGVWDAG
jgi:peptidoglycan hydrolase-like amidase